MSIRLAGIGETLCQRREPNLPPQLPSLVYHQAPFLNPTGRLPVSALIEIESRGKCPRPIGEGFERTSKETSAITVLRMKMPSNFLNIVEPMTKRRSVPPARRGDSNPLSLRLMVLQFTSVCCFCKSQMNRTIYKRILRSKVASDRGLTSEAEVNQEPAKAVVERRRNTRNGQQSHLSEGFGRLSADQVTRWWRLRSGERMGALRSLCLLETVLLDLCSSSDTMVQALSGNCICEYESQDAFRLCPRADALGTEECLSVQVFLAHHATKDRHVALKVITTDACGPSADQLPQPMTPKLADFMVECSILESLRHPNIVTSYGHFTDTSGGRQYAGLATEAAAGRHFCTSA